jgi:hypothetical protein
MQTDADRERVVEGLMATEGGVGLERDELAARVKTLSPRWFVMRDAARGPGCVLVQSRATMCWLRGPMVRSEIARRRAPGERGG